MDPLISAVLSTRGKHPALPGSRRPASALPLAPPRGAQQRARRPGLPAQARQSLRVALRRRAAAALRWAAERLDAGVRSGGAPQPGSST